MEYAKAIAAAVGLAAIIAKQIFGIEIGGEQVNKITDGIIAIGTVFAVYQTPNKAK